MHVYINEGEKTEGFKQTAMKKKNKEGKISQGLNNFRARTKYVSWTFSNKCFFLIKWPARVHCLVKN